MIIPPHVWKPYFIDTHTHYKQGPQGPQKLSSLKSLEIIKKTLEHGNKKWLPYKIIGATTVKKVQIDPQTTEIWRRKFE